MHLGEKTVVPIGWFFGALSVAGLSLSTVVAVAVYISKIEAKAESSLNAIDSQERRIDGIADFEPVRLCERTLRLNKGNRIALPG